MGTELDDPLEVVANTLCKQIAKIPESYLKSWYYFNVFFNVFFNCFICNL